MSDTKLDDAAERLNAIRPSSYYRGDGNHGIADLQRLILERNEEIYHLRLLAQDLLAKSGARWALAESDVVRELVSALEFYANKHNWASRSGKIGVTPIWTEDQELAEGHTTSVGGKSAREALAKYKAAVEEST
jgi:hypothetical protein